MSAICIQNDIPPLFKAYENYFHVGTALNHFAFLHNNTESEIVKKHFNLITAENATKMDNIFLSENNLNFSIVDKFIEFGKNNKKNIHWHTLVSNKQTPKWIFEKNNETVSKSILEQRLKKYIQTVCDYTKDSIYSYDVINEAFSNNEGRLRTIKEGSFWQHILGDDYINNLFLWAKEANPKAELILNESDLTINKNKRNNFAEFSKKLILEKVPVSTIGMQLHINMNEPDISEIEDTIELFGKLGLKVAISALDISLYTDENEKTKEYTKELLELQAQRYYQLFECFKKESARGILSSVTFWGVTDKSSWKNDNPVEKRTDAPLIFDRNGIAKPAFFSLLNK